MKTDSASLPDTNLTELLAKHAQICCIFFQYNFNPETGEWRHKNHQVFRDRAWLGHINYNTGCMTRRVNDNSKWIEKTKESPKGHEDCLRQACDLFDQSAKVGLICMLKFQEN